MAQPTTNLRVRISADLRDIKQGLGLLRGELAKVKAESARALPSGNGFAAGLRTARRELVAFAGIYLSLRTARVFAGLSDEATQLRGRLRAARGDYEAILALAQETRSGLAGTVDLYTKLERSTRSQALNGDRLLTVTKAVNQAVKLSFADAGTAQGAITQLGQGLASGILRGEELNSVLEGTPRLAQAIADGLGVPLGKLRALAKEGKLTTTAVIKALEEQASALEEEYGQVPVTIGDAITQVRNSFLDFIGDQNEATGSAQRFAKLLQQVAKDLPNFFEPILQVMVQLASNLGDVEKSSDGVAGSADRAGQKVEGLAGAGRFLANVLRVVATAGIVVKNVVEAITVVVAALSNAAFTTAEVLGKVLGGAFATLAGSFEVLKTDGPLAALKAYRQGAGQVVSDFTLLGRQLKGQAKLAGESISSEFRDATGGIASLFSEAEAGAANSAAAIGAASAGAAEDAEDANGKAGKAIAASNALLRDSIARALKELDRLYDANLVSIEQYFAARRKLQEDAIDADIAQSRAELAITKDKGARRKIEEDLIKLGRDRAEVAVTTAREEQLANDKLIDQLGEIKATGLELDGEAAKAARIRLETEYLDLFKRLAAESDEAGKAMVRNLIERLVSKAQLDQLRNQSDEITSALQGSETNLSAQASAGLLGGLESERQIAAARAQALAQLRELRQATIDYLNTLNPASPEAAQARAYLQSLGSDIANIIASQQQFRQDVESAGQSSLLTFFTDLKDGALSAADAVRGLAKSFADALFQMAAAAVSKRIVSAISGLFNKGESADVGQGAAKLSSAATATALAGGVIQFGASALSQAAKELQAAAITLLAANTTGSFFAAHGGGTVGSLQQIRHGINPMVFGAAPRYHRGGVAGLRPGEVPAVLEEGERIRTAEQEAALQSQLKAGSSGGSGTVTTPIVAIGDAAIADALASAAGERVVLTHVRNNWSSLSRGTG